MQVLEYEWITNLMRYCLIGVGLFEGIIPKFAKGAICSQDNKVDPWLLLQWHLSEKLEGYTWRYIKRSLIL